MAIATLHPMFRSISGRVGGVVFYSYNEVTYFRAYVVPRNPDTSAQRSNRRLFARAMRAWQELSLFDKGSFNRRARRLGMTGHNLFISRYMARRAPSCAEEPSPEPPGQASPGGFTARSAFSSPVHSIGRSVVHPVTVRDTRDAASCRDSARCAPKVDT